MSEAVKTEYILLLFQPSTGVYIQHIFYLQGVLDVFFF